MSSARGALERGAASLTRLSFTVVTFDIWRIIRGDRVQVLSGKSKGQRGIVKRVDRSRNLVVVEGVTDARVVRVYVRLVAVCQLLTSSRSPGVNLVKKHQAGQAGQKGGTFTKEAPVQVSQVSLLDPKDDKPCRTKWVFLEDGSKVRQSKRSGLVIPKNDLVLKAKKPDKTAGVAGVLDTPPEIVTQITFSMTELVPKLNWNKQ